jgi:flagellar hook assembly protein FlgD
VKEGTSFVFRHNKPGQDVNVVIRIYSISGALIQTLQYTFNTEYLESGPLYWNGRDSGGNLVPGGLYVYQALVASNTGLASSLSQKMLIVR